MKKHIPNIITCCNLICGCIATYSAFHHSYQDAFFFILLGALFDFFDGKMARALGCSTMWHILRSWAVSSSSA